MVSGPAIAVVLAVALAWFVGTEVVDGAKWLGKEAKKGGAAIVHVLKKIPHPHHEDTNDD
jgi:hypothetical protein